MDFFRYDGANPNDLIVFQINMRHAAVVTHEIRDLYTSRDADIVLMQEPYTYKGKLPGIGIGTRIVTVHNCEEPRAAIVAHRDRVSVTKLSQFCDQHTVCVEVQSPAVTFYAVWCYFQFAEQPERYLSFLSNILRGLRGKKILFGIDSNAKSPLWDSDIEDHRSESVENFIAEYNLHVLNNSTTPTFSSGRGEANIDVTLVADNFFPHISSWSILPGVTTSDHRVLETRIKLRDTAEIGESEKPQPKRFLLTRVDRERFNRCLKESADTILSSIEITDEESVECLAKRISKTIVDACEASMPRKKWSKKSQPLVE